jgi:hypothetical protein
MLIEVRKSAGSDSCGRLCLSSNAIRAVVQEGAKILMASCKEDHARPHYLRSEQIKSSTVIQDGREAK